MNRTGNGNGNGGTLVPLTTMSSMNSDGNRVMASIQTTEPPSSASTEILIVAGAALLGGIGYGVYAFNK
jgi:hypothetical protein